VQGTEKAMSAFVVGLFSLLDTILDAEMTTVIDKLPMSGEIKKTLLGEASEYSGFLHTAKAFESGLWSTIIANAERLNIPQQELHSCFNDAMRWSNEMRQALSDFFPQTKATS
jgi:EAL and modified HD-GYP domain-containing signal transduction protein